VRRETVGEGQGPRVRLQQRGRVHSLLVKVRGVGMLSGFVGLGCVGLVVGVHTSIETNHAPIGWWPIKKKNWVCIILCTMAGVYCVGVRGGGVCEPSQKYNPPARGRGRRLVGGGGGGQTGEFCVGSVAVVGLFVLLAHSFCVVA